jgi:hypothetical protein
MMIVYERRMYSEVYEELNTMFHDHWNELGHKGGFNDLVLDIPKYMYLETAGNLLFTVAVKDGVTIGYVNCVLGTFNHNANETIATVDAMYVAKEHRATMAGVGYRLLKFTENLLVKDFNAKAINFAVNVNYDISGFLTKTGYTHSETTYIKKLGD